MADSTPQSISRLHDAITAARKECGNDPDCARIITLADSLESEIEKAYPAEEQREKPSDPDEPEPKSLKQAGAEMRDRLRSGK